MLSFSRNLAKGSEMGVTVSNELERTPYAVRQWLENDQRLYTATPWGTATRGTPSTFHSYCIMKEPPMRSWWYYLFLGSILLRRDIVGQVKIGNEVACKPWKIKVYGRDNLPFMQELAKKLSERFKVQIELVLASEYPGREAFSFDWD